MRNTDKRTIQNQGFTLFEALIAITVGITLFALLLSIYVLSIQSLTTGQDRSEITQDSRITIERITRDIRQSRDIATILPEDNSDPENPALSEIQMQDGHTSVLQYITYYVSGTDLKRKIIQYSFASDPSVLVPFDAEDDFSNPAIANTISDNVVGKYINSILFYGNNPITIELTLQKGTIIHETRSIIYGRNL